MNKLLIAVIAIVAVAVIAAAAFALNNPSEPSSVEPTTTPTATVTASSTPTSTINPTPTTSANDSAVITFTETVRFLETSFSSASAKTKTYQVWAYASWDPAPYVRYYEVSLDYGNNSKPLENKWSSGDYQLWGTSGNELGPFPWEANKIYILGPEGVSHPKGQPYRGLFDNPETWLTVAEDGTKVYGPKMWDTSKHGVTICTLSATFPDDGSVSSAQMGQVATDMLKFLEEYTRSWTVTLKNVS
ncbi:MAG: hypothetical protein ACQCN5_00310 [Candidatus Bathyarchaeia archaeon]|jgi:hypothetical protein